MSRMLNLQFTLAYFLFVKFSSQLDDNQLSSCTNDEFQCKTGECIPNHYVCDGYSDCRQSSDENIFLCANERCPPEISFQCAYGGCIEVEQKCDGIIHCLDQSDEDQILCGYPTPLRPGCEKPTRLTNAGCSIIDCEQLYRVGECTENMDTKNACIELACESGYILDDFRAIFRSRCIDDVWTPQLPVCQECGVDHRNTSSISGGNDIKNPVPWHAGLYWVKGNKARYFCGGTIVHYKAVITAARCLRTFKDGFPKEFFPQNELAIVIGKNTRDFYTNETNQQTFKAVDVKIRDYTQDYENDLAILILNEKIRPNQDVMPACLQGLSDNYGIREQTFYLDERQDGSNIPDDWPMPDNTTGGKIVGWKPETGDNNTIMREADFHICCNYSQCVRKVAKSDRRWVTPDKFCVDQTVGMKIGQGDDGAGFIIEYHGRHYLYGIVSFGTDRMRLFTFLGFDGHRSWVSRNLDVN